MRFTACCTSGSKSWMPRLQRLKPTLARSRSVSVVMVRGSSSIEYSRCRVARQLEVAAELLDQPVDLERGEEGGRAAAEVQLLDLAVLVVELALQLDLAVQPVEVSLGLLVVAGDDLGAAAVEARARAERDVHVQRQRPRDRVLVAGERRGLVLVQAELVGELHGRRVRGVARAGPVVAADEVGVEPDLVRIHRFPWLQGPRADCARVGPPALTCVKDGNWTRSGNGYRP